MTKYWLLPVWGIHHGRPCDTPNLLLSKSSQLRTLNQRLDQKNSERLPANNSIWHHQKINDQGLKNCCITAATPIALALLKYQQQWNT